MKNSSLEEATSIIIKALDKSHKIDMIDKTELMVNITQFLDKREYRENTKILEKRRTKNWKKH